VEPRVPPRPCAGRPDESPADNKVS
jgi:hypothetical protein